MSRGLESVSIHHDVMEEDSLAGKRQIKLMQNEVLTLVGRLNDAYQERDELRHCVRAIEGFPDKPALLLSLQRENLVLKKQLLSAQPAREHASCSEVGSLGPIDVDPRAELELIKDSVADACASLEGDERILDPSKDHSASLVLSQWASKVFGQDLDFKSFIASCKKSGMKMIDVLRSLVATSLWALVWQHPFEEIANAESPMHDPYKKQLLARCKSYHLRWASHADWPTQMGLMFASLTPLSTGPGCRSPPSKISSTAALRRYRVTCATHWPHCWTPNRGRLM